MSSKFADTNDGIELPANDSHDREGERENLKTIELKVCELARTSLETAQKLIRSSSSPNFRRTQGGANLAKKLRGQPARLIDQEITGGLDQAADNVRI